jgi:ABC-type molybdenum transport system ATPase subunit/photorepair protein PhrA
LAQASVQVDGLHPGLVVLDEPLQQNPDPKHRERFLSFLSNELAKKVPF